MAAAAVPSSAEAWQFSEYGGIDALTLGPYPLRELVEGEVLVEVYAAALNPVDAVRRKGFFKSVPNFSEKLPVVYGYDGAGVVRKVGPGVAKIKEGDAVYGNIQKYGNSPGPYGTLSTFTIAKEEQLALKPTNLSWEEAAALPVAILTGLNALDKVELPQGGKVLITGGAGGVGSHTIQVAKKIFGATVATTASGVKVDFVKGLGADIVVDYKKEKFAEVLDKDFDVVFDTTAEVEPAKQVVKPSGKVVSIAAWGVPGVISFGLVSLGADLDRLRPYLEDGSIKAVIDPKGRFRFDDVLKAAEYAENGRPAGKVVVTVKP